MDHDKRTAALDVNQLSLLLEADRDPSVDYTLGDRAVFEWMTTPAFQAEADTSYDGALRAVTRKLVQLLVDLTSSD